MDSIFKDHFYNPRNMSDMADADGIGSAGDKGCGARITIFLRFSDDRLSACSYQASGSSAIIAAGSLLSVMITEMSWNNAAAIAPALLEKSLSHQAGDIRSSTEHIEIMSEYETGRLAQAADFAIEALHAALEDSIKRGNFPIAPTMDEDHVLVAMSGGVDSSVACLLEKKAGRRVTGVTMRLWTDPECEPDEEGATCCSPRAIRDARAVCHDLGLAHLTVDYADTFESEIVDYFTGEYIAGRTPNPCTRCNGVFRFPALVALADRIGAARVATGHYALIVVEEGRRLLARGQDSGKDQSYMLWGISPGLLERLEFPLGHTEKVETRKIARDAGFIAHARPESQEVCFIPDDDYRRFLRTRLHEMPGEGDIVAIDGSKLGTHDGYINFTIGQRRGLGVSSAEPLYVLSTSPEDNLVTVGTRKELTVNRLMLKDMNCFISPEHLANEKLLVQARYNSTPVTARIVQVNQDEWKIELDDPLYGVAPGQSAVIYLGEAVGAGGIITSTA
ncbi:MAG: tRNA 2-thiouridine(34) synthase MnmA [Thermoleophilia bacterium]|jgi:tRNA-specific 2-thiouridylase